MNLYIADIRKVRNYILSDEKHRNNFHNKNRITDKVFSGFLKEPSNKIKKDIFKGKENIPILIINPIFGNSRASSPYHHNEDSESQNLNLNNFNNFYKSINDSQISRGLINSNDVLNQNERSSLPSDSSQNTINYYYLNDKLCLGFID